MVSRSSLATVPCGVSREEETGRSHSTKKGAFHEVFNLAESERPLAGEGTHCNIKKKMIPVLICAECVKYLRYLPHIELHFL